MLQHPVLLCTAPQVGSPFGGLLYVVVGEGLSGGLQSVVVSGAVRAPHFKKGRDSNAAWASAK